MTRVPILTEVVLRAWGTDDPRVVGPLRAENPPRSRSRAKGAPCSVQGMRAIEQRARDAGWPEEYGFGNEDAKKAMSRAMRRLEGVDFRRGRGSMTREEAEDEWLVAHAAER